MTSEKLNGGIFVDAPNPIPSDPFNKTIGYFAGRYRGSNVSSSAPMTISTVESFQGVSGSDKFDIYLEGVVYDIISHLTDDNHIYITDDDYQKYVIGDKFRSDVERIVKNHILPVLQDMVIDALQPKAY